MGQKRRNGTKVYEVLDGLSSHSYNSVIVESQKANPKPDAKPDRVDPDDREGTLIGSGARDWLLQRFAEIDTRFRPAPRSSSDPE